MAPRQLPPAIAQRLLADWFRRLANDDGIPLHSYGISGETITLGAADSFQVIATFVDDFPHLEFRSSQADRQATVDELAKRAIDRVQDVQIGETVWYTAHCVAADHRFAGTSWLGSLIERLGNQTRISGWRRLGNDILIEFIEAPLQVAVNGNVLFAPATEVNVHLSIQAPCQGLYSDPIAHEISEIASAICTLALGRTVDLPPTVFPTEESRALELSQIQRDPAVLTLARKSISLDIFSHVIDPDNLELFLRARSAILTFNAAMSQQSDAIACILYVVAVESLTTPNAEWRTERLTKRFIEFYDELIPEQLNEIVDHGNFETVFGIKRSTRTERALRRELLSNIYGFRSGNLHTGLRPSFRGFFRNLSQSDEIRRGLFSSFAEAAILQFLASPRSSLIGHPNFAPASTWSRDED